jgi:hypothetical protein
MASPTNSRTNWKAGSPTTDLSAEELIALGYRKTSNAYGLVSRIDRPDWVEVLAQEMRRAPADFIVRDGSGRISPSWCDHYRRVYSKDTHTVDPERIARIPTSDHDPVGYVEIGACLAKAA